MSWLSEILAVLGFHSHPKARWSVGLPVCSIFGLFGLHVVFLNWDWLSSLSWWYSDIILGEIFELFQFFLSRAPRFKGYQQQDSQELLHYLMDSIRVEETKVRPWHTATCSVCSTNSISFTILWNFCGIFQVSASHLLVADEACRHCCAHIHGVPDCHLCFIGFRTYIFYSLRFKKLRDEG